MNFIDEFKKLGDSLDKAMNEVYGNLQTNPEFVHLMNSRELVLALKNSRRYAKLIKFLIENHFVKLQNLPIKDSFSIEVEWDDRYIVLDGDINTAIDKLGDINTAVDALPE